MALNCLDQKRENDNRLEHVCENPEGTQILIEHYVKNLPGGMEPPSSYGDPEYRSFNLAWIFSLGHIAVIFRVFVPMDNSLSISKLFCLSLSGPKRVSPIQP